MEYIFSSFLPYIVPQFYLPADMPRHNALIFFSALDEIVCNISSFVFFRFMHAFACCNSEMLLGIYLFIFFLGGGRIIIMLMLSAFKEKLSYVLSID